MVIFSYFFCLVFIVFVLIFFGFMVFVGSFDRFCFFCLSVCLLGVVILEFVESICCNRFCFYV